MFYRFTKGLKCLGVLDRIRNYPGAMRGLFVHKSDLVVDAVEMDNMFVVEFSEEGSNKYINELRIQTYWRDYLLEIEGIWYLLSYNSDFLCEIVCINVNY